MEVISHGQHDAELTALIRHAWDQAAETEAAFFAPEKGREILQKVLKRTPGEQHAGLVYLLRRMAVAASILLVIAGTYYWYRDIYKKNDARPALAAVRAITPGRAGAVLTLSNGQRLVLDSLQDGKVAVEGKSVILKTAGEIRYQGTIGNEKVFNTITTDRGRQWALVLPDGSRVWLNAASSIRYPLYFAGRERVVEVTGEAYFEVVHNAKQPFKVKAAGQVIEDIGTAFNVNAYTDEPAIKTTLVEGSIRLMNNTERITLKPGQQAQVQTNGKLTVVPDADVDRELAWHKGSFSFRHTDLPAVMRQLARWYDVDIQYEKNIPVETFSGDMGRNLNLSDVLDFMKQMHVHFRIEESKRVIVVTP
jgi:ferric-dicitrate binding protein FerR (iron transport regulator)